MRRKGRKKFMIPVPRMLLNVFMNRWNMSLVKFLLLPNPLLWIVENCNDVSCTACNCAVFLFLKKLLCKRIIAYHKDNGVKLFSVSEVRHRFLLTTFLNDTRVHS